MLSFIAFQGKYNEAEPLARRYLATIEQVSDHPEVAEYFDTLASILRAQVIYVDSPEKSSHTRPVLL